MLRVVECWSMNSLPRSGPFTCCSTLCCFHTHLWRNIYALGRHIQGLMEQILYFWFNKASFKPDCFLKKARFCPSCCYLLNSAQTCCAKRPLLQQKGWTKTVLLQSCGAGVPLPRTLWWLSEGCLENCSKPRRQTMISALTDSFSLLKDKPSPRISAVL